MTKHELSPELNAKVKKNLLWIFIFASFMIFAGLTSAYIVSQGSYFWVNIAMPSGFKLSTTVIIVSSLCLFVAAYAVQKEKYSLMKGALGLAFLGSVLFGIFQFKAFKQLFQGGSAVTGTIMTVEGRYGKYFSLTYEGKNISYDNDVFYLKGDPISEELHDQIRTIGEELEAGAKNTDKVFELSNYGAKFMLLFGNEPVIYTNGKLSLVTGDFPESKYLALNRFGENLKTDRGDFIMDGKYGTDFWIYYNGNKLEYEHREFYIDGQKISPKLENDLFSQQNMASSFIYVFTGVHLLHWIGGVIALLVVFIRGLGNKYTKTNYLGIMLGSMYWHFLGILWLYLYGFLIFIH